eukprot:6450922-Prymnesium_polylepis.1
MSSPNHAISSRHVLSASSLALRSASICLDCGRGALGESNTPMECERQAGSTLGATWGRMGGA